VIGSATPFQQLQDLFLVFSIHVALLKKFALCFVFWRYDVLSSRLCGERCGFSALFPCRPTQETVLVQLFSHTFSPFLSRGPSHLPFLFSRPNIHAFDVFTVRIFDQFPSWEIEPHFGSSSHQRPALLSPSTKFSYAHTVEVIGFFFVRHALQCFPIFSNPR